MAIAIIPYAGSATSVVISLAVILNLVAMALAANAAHLASVARGHLSATRVFTRSVLIGATVCAIQSLLFGILYWPLPAFAIAAIASIIAAALFNWKLSTTKLDGFGVE